MYFVVIVIFAVRIILAFVVWLHFMEHPILKRKAHKQSIFNLHTDTLKRTHVNCQTVCR